MGGPPNRPERKHSIEYVFAHKTKTLKGRAATPLAAEARSGVRGQPLFHSRYVIELSNRVTNLMPKTNASVVAEKPPRPLMPGDAPSNISPATVPC